MEIIGNVLTGCVQPKGPDLSLAIAPTVGYPFLVSSVAEIEQAIAKLPIGEFVQLERWFDAERNRKWDLQIEGDAQSGKLREVYERLQSENLGQANVPLDDFLDNEKLS